MKKWLLALLTALAVFALAACGGSDDKKDEKAGKDGGKDDKEIVIGASNVPHAVILEEAKPLLEKKAMTSKLKHFRITCFQTSL